MTKILLDGSSLTLEKAEAIAKGSAVQIAQSSKKRIEAARAYVDQVASENKPIYAINTGFGYLANQLISKENRKQLQLNLLRSHAAGYGEALSSEQTRLAMALRLNVLLKGFTGVRFELCKKLASLINAEIHPVIPKYGSVGASGDLAPLAHLALALIGEGKVNFKGKIVNTKSALNKAKIKPITLQEKEGLSLINGTQVMLAVGGLAISEAKRLIKAADKIAALSFEGLEALLPALDSLLHQLRAQPGQIESAKALSKELKGSYLNNHKPSHKRVQDPYSLRCTPQVHGASRDVLNSALQIVERELNAATDNPLVFPERNRIVSGGNFHGQYLAMAFDMASIALSEIANISDRRLELLLNPHLSGLPAFLTPYQGTNSGYMATQYLSASLVNQNKLLANPACTDSIPGNVGVEDHVSMGMTSARKLKDIVDNCRVVLAAEMLAACQAIDLRKVKKLGVGTKKSYQLLRAKVSQLKRDRIVANDIERAVGVISGL